MHSAVYSTLVMRLRLPAQSYELPLISLFFRQHFCNSGVANRRWCSKGLGAYSNLSGRVGGKIRPFFQKSRKDKEFWENCTF